MPHRKVWSAARLIFLCAAFIAGLPVPTGALALPPSRQGGSLSLQAPALQPEVLYAVDQDTSPPLREMTPSSTQLEGETQVTPRFFFPNIENSPPPAPLSADPLLQRQLAAWPETSQMPPAQFNFDGTSNMNGVLPPDPNGDVGPNHYVQWVNLSLAIWRIDRATHTAEPVYGPVAGNTIWAGFGGACEQTNHGDPIVLYDHLAGRWFISQFSVSKPYYQCIAVSQTDDPTGAWHRYAFTFSVIKMNDYPHFGVWPDGYYMSVNQFIGNSFAGAGVVVYEREKMQAGLPARQVYFDLEAVNPSFGGMLPADLDGPPPPAGTPNVFVQASDSTQLWPQDALRLWEFRVNWTNPGLSSFGLSGQPNLILPVANFTPLCINKATCIPQPNTTQLLDAIGDRLMHRLQYRNFGTYAALVANHTVDAGGGRAGIRWYELRDGGGAWNIYQQGTHAVADGHYRWMGSAAMDRSGNLAIGYSISGESLYPSIRYAGRLSGDPPGTLAQGESTLIQGNGSQLYYTRWGDYSMLAVDPLDGCTFWFTSEYYPVTSSIKWRTRIGSFAFPSCIAGNNGKLQGTVTDEFDIPLAEALVEIGGSSTQTDANGFYQFLNFQPGTHPIQVSKYGYASVVDSVEISADFVSTKNFRLAALPRKTITGVVRDGSGQGWPLYARLQVTAPGDARAVYTEPASGAYQIDLVEGIPHTFTVQAVAGGYSEAVTVVTPNGAASPLNFELVVDSGACRAPGYAAAGSCTAQPGGLLLGHVLDGNTSLAIDGAAVTRGGIEAQAALTAATPQDPGIGDGFYLLFAPPGEQAFTASAGAYGEETFGATVVAGTVITHTFQLPAGLLAPAPSGLEVELSLVKRETLALTLVNRGELPAAFHLTAVNAPVPALNPTGPFASQTRRVSPKRLDDPNAASVYDYRPPEVQRLPGGGIYRTWISGLAANWGIGIDPTSGDLWLSSIPEAGQTRLQRFLADGSETADAIDLPSQEISFFADMAYHPLDRKFWQVPVGGDDCLVEIDAAGRAATGRKICPGFGASQRGLAYNPLDGTFYSGSWNSGILYHFDAAGRILDSANTSLNISGLAFNPSTRHLFVLSNADQGFDVYLLDTANQYQVLGGFDIDGLEGYQQAGLEIGCDGHLWTVNQASGAVLEADSGENSICAWDEIPWLSFSPASGTIPAHGEQLIQISIETRSAVSGVQNAYLVVSSDTPYGPITIPLTATSQNEVILPITMNRYLIPPLWRSGLP